MGKPTAKRLPKTTLKPTAPQPSKPPAPYSTPPPVLRPFLETLDPKHIYIIHIDNHPKALKKRIFVVPVLLNIVITFLLLWRAQVAMPYYIELLLSILGVDNRYKIDVKRVDWATIADAAMGRTFMFFIDFSLAKFVLPWPWEFFIGPVGSPVKWRRSVGFQDEEVVVRRSRRWDQTLPTDWLAEDADGIVYQERIMPAVDKKWIRAKTSYLMMDKSWDLDFAGMVAAHKLIKEGKASLQDFQKTVITHSEEHGWIIWPLWKLDEGAEEEGRKKVVFFKDKLTAIGKENLFFRWVELIQFETSQPGGFTAERQAKTMKETKELFESHGIDFEKFWEEVGGIQGLPGMEITSCTKQSEIALTQ